MSFVIVNYCPKCGAPIWIDQTELSLGLVPKTVFSCACNPEKNGTKDTEVKPGSIEVEITCTASGSSPKTILYG